MVEYAPWRIEAMTENEILSIEMEIEDYNNEQRQKAIEEFKDGPVPKMRWTMNYVLKRLLEHIADVRSGDAPEGFGEYMRDELARILSTRTFLEYDGLSLNEDAAKEADSNTSFEDVSNDCFITGWTEEYGEWCKIATALVTYLHEAAILAKSVNPSSTAARLYLRAWRIASMANGRGAYCCHANKDEALAIVRLERVASERLWVDVQFAALPPFKAKGKAKVKAKGKAKAKAKVKGKAKGKAKA
jgi:hypothetical protein